MTLLTTLRNYLFCFRSQVLMLTQMAPYCSPILVLIRPTFYTFLHSLVQITLYTSVDLWLFLSFNNAFQPCYFGEMQLFC